MKILIEILLFIYLVGHPNIGVILNANSTQDPMISLINTERSKNGRSKLVENSKLNTSAKNKACDIYNRGYWSHDTPEGKKFWTFIVTAGYNYYYSGENLCRIGNDQECMTAFMASPTHRANILDGGFKEVGIGKCGNITVQHFGTSF